MTTFAERLADFAVSLPAEELPPEVTACAVESLVDTVGCALAGATAPVAHAVRSASTGLAARGAATVIGSPGRLTPAYAAFANATAAHALELDDTDAKSFCHTGAVVIPAVLATAEAHGRSGRDLLAAIVVGYETTLRLARWVNPAHRLRGFHTTATVPTIGAAAAVARLRTLTAAQTASAMGVAGSFASGTFEFLTSGSNLKRVHAGKAAFGAVLAVDLAVSGVDGPASVLEGCHGLYATMAGDEVPELPLTDLGERFLIREVGRKPYPCCRFCHASIDVAIELHRPGIRGDDLSRIQVDVSELCATQTGLTTPVNELQRQFSTPYGVALGLLRGAVSLSDYRDRPDREALRLAGRIEVRVDADLPLTDRASTVTVYAADGSRRLARTRVPLGEPSNPLTDDQLRRKFFDLAAQVLPVATAGELFKTLSACESLTDLRDVSALLELAGRGRPEGGATG